MKKEPQSFEIGFRRNGMYFSCCVIIHINKRFYFIFIDAIIGCRGLEALQSLTVCSSVLACLEKNVHDLVT